MTVMLLMRVTVVGLWRHQVGSVGILFANALDLVQTEPVVGLGYFAQTHDKFMVLLGHLRGLDEHAALRFGHRENPVLAPVPVDFDLKAAVQEPGGDVLGRHFADFVQRNVHPSLGFSYFTNFF